MSASLKMLLRYPAFVTLTVLTFFTRLEDVSSHREAPLHPQMLHEVS